MSTKDYPLDIIEALHLLTGDEPETLISSDGSIVKREDDSIFISGGLFSLSDFVNSFERDSFRIYEPPAPKKLEPVELCSELFDIVDDFHAAPSFYRKIYGLLIAQAVRMAREEREAEKKGDGR